MNDKLWGQSFSSLPRSKKTVLILLLLITIVILITWFWQFNSRINNPFVVKPNAQDLANLNKIDEQAISKVTDTDNDGITDFNENNIYNTSPYLEDTDGDGILDGVEIKNNTNPLCYEGRDCSVNSTTNATSTDIYTSTSTISVGNSVSGNNVDQSLLIQALSGAGDPTILRQLLLQGGANAESLNSLSDEDLMASYREVLAAQNPAALSVVNATTTASSTISQ